MACNVMVVTSGKGGVGKTTVTANLGMALASLGEKVALIDADIGLRNLDIVLGLENRIVFNVLDVVEKRCKLRQALVKDKRQPNLVLLPASQYKDKNAVTPEQMKEICLELENDFSFVIIDCPAGIEQGFYNAIEAAKEAIIVSTPEIASVRDADRVTGLLQAKGIDSIYLIINRIRPDMIKTNDMLSVKDVEDILEVKTIGIIPDDESIIITTNKGEPAVLNDKSFAGKAFINIARRIQGEELPFLKLDSRKNFMGLLKKFFK